MSDPGQPAPARPRKAAAAFRTIGEVADELDLPTHVLRFWETKFPQLKPVKRNGGRRYYRPEDIRLLRRIRQWLYDEGYTIRGAQRLLENDPPAAADAGDDLDTAVPFAAAMPDAGAGLGGETASSSEAEDTDRAEAAAPHVPDRKPAFLDPETRAELEDIRRELLHARDLLDGLLRFSKTS